MIYYSNMDLAGMSMKWISLLVPISLFVIAAPAFSQSTFLSNAAVDGGDDQSNTSLIMPFDSTAAIYSPDSTLVNSFSGWYKKPGHMPVLIAPLLPNSMPVLNWPLVDEKMIIPIADVAADTLYSPYQRK